jgi:hypothetical protein
LLFAALLASTACHTMRPLALEDITSARPDQVWVTKPDESVVVLSLPQIVNNRLAGFVDGVYRVMPTAEVQSMRVRHTAVGRTAALVTAGGLAIASVIALISGSGASVDPCMVASSECDPGD